MVGGGKGEAYEDKAGEHEGGGDVDAEEAGFWFEDVQGVTRDGETGERVVEVVAEDFAEESRDDGGEVEVA